MSVLFAMSHSSGVALTVAIILALAICGCIVITDDFDWFD